MLFRGCLSCAQFLSLSIPDSNNRESALRLRARTELAGPQIVLFSDTRADCEVDLGCICADSFDHSS